MATETTTLNAAAAAYYPSEATRAVSTHADASAPKKSQPRRRQGGNKKKPTDEYSAPEAARPRNGVEALVPSSVQRRRKPAAKNGPVNGKTTESEHTSPDTKKNKKPARTTQKKDEEEVDEDADMCLLCADPIQFYAVGECNHHGICSKCSMRMRMLMDDRNCPICKQHLDRVVVYKTQRSFESFQLWGDAGGRDSVLDEPSEIIFYECRAHYNTLRGLRDYACRMKRCKVVCGSMHKLKDHLRIEHSTEFCELCLSHQHFFVQEHPVFTKAGLKAHNVGRNRSTGPKASGKDFHPMCQFCKRRFYGDMQLYEHLERDHFRCHICKIEHEYFRNYSSLEAHFRREHFLCEESTCLANRFVVFPNDIEYHAHMQSIHGVMNRLVLNFQVARGGENPLGGPALMGGDDVPDSWNYETTEGVNLRATQAETAFPALPTPSTPAPPPVSQPAIAPRAAVTRSISAQQIGFSARLGGANGAPRGQVLRNQRLAEALGLARPGQSTEAFEQEMETPNYPSHLVDWAKANVSYLQVVERRLERIVQDTNCHSVSLRPMPAEERALMHQLASFYDVPSESFGEDPFRRISFFKRDTARVPKVTLSTFLRKANTQARSGAASRLSFLPLRSGPAQAPPQNAPPPRPAAPVSRGWEKIEPKPKPVILDAWSDDEDSGEAEASTE
ncbi:hypothetical protein Poli38472_003655 [Pythium oligandrum]|uniref:RING-type E3 ubiquitin transferase n=1 Tax=Pythium oligandrum TaxID=41045 RepID=A0A8K1CM94_PYTOL|nr:hypothetical protein Poli38472_003655 [Pythium oligandrum]|eukprot:TMW65890.1 hypothetical protein Poli38472_003655 [Pythium oligandrum]